MSADLSASARCFALEVDGQPIAFCGVIALPVSSGARRGEAIDRVSRIVVLPDWQGCGAAFRLLETVGAAYTALGRRFRNYPAAPGFIAAYRRKPTLWRQVSEPQLRPRDQRGRGDRPCAVFEYVGPALEQRAAERLLALG